MIEASMDEIAGSAADSGEMRSDRYRIVALEWGDRINAKASSAAPPQLQQVREAGQHLVLATFGTEGPRIQADAVKLLNSHS